QRSSQHYDAGAQIGPGKVTPLQHQAKPNGAYADADVDSTHYCSQGRATSPDARAVHRQGQERRLDPTVADTVENRSNQEMRERGGERQYAHRHTDEHHARQNHYRPTKAVRELAGPRPTDNQANRV